MRTSSHYKNEQVHTERDLIERVHNVIASNFGESKFGANRFI
jgi:hypothetical protein